MLNGESGEDRSANAHWGRQIALLTDSEGAWHIHAVARLENLEADIAAIFQQRGLPSLCFTKFKNRRESYQNPNESVFYTDNEFYWSAANEANILIRYAEDYARLNYQPFALQAQLL